MGYIRQVTWQRYSPQNSYSAVNQGVNGQFAAEADLTGFLVARNGMDDQLDMVIIQEGCVVPVVGNGF